MPRLFVALNFSSRVNEKILNSRCSVPSVKWLPENQIHTTLKFIGNVNNNLYDEITEALGQIDFQPLEIIQLKAQDAFRCGALRRFSG